MAGVNPLSQCMCFADHELVNPPASFASKSLLGLKTVGYLGQQSFVRLTEPKVGPKRGREAILTEYREVAKDRQFQANEVVGVDPILGRLSNESTLTTSSRGIPFDWMTTSSDEIIKFREFNDEPIIVELIKRPFLEVFLNESGLQRPASSFLMECISDSRVRPLIDGH